MAQSQKSLRGLEGLYGPPGTQAIMSMDEGVLEARAAPGTGTKHKRYGSQALGYGGPVPKESPGYQFNMYDAGGVAGEYIGTDFDDPGNETIDRTPDKHGSPYPKGIVETRFGFSSGNTPAGLELAGEQLRQLHGTDYGGQYWFTHSPAGRQTTTRYTTDRYPAPNESILAPVPGQIKSGGIVGFGGSRAGGASGSGQSDTDQGYGVLNTLDEFKRGHSIRRVQHDRMPWDFTAIHGEQEVPFLGRHQMSGRQMTLAGPDSPYYEAGDISQAMIPWEGRIGYPHEYEQAPEPFTEPARLAQMVGEEVWAYE